MFIFNSCECIIGVIIVIIDNLELVLVYECIEKS